MKKAIGFSSVLLSISVSACDSGGTAEPAADASSTEDVSLFCSAGGRGAEQACTRGSLLDPDGTAVVGVRVTACTPSTCITGTSDERGDFVIAGLPVEPHKMEVLGFIKGYYSAVYYVDMVAGTFVAPAAPIHLHRLPDQMVKGFVPADGGSLVLADGAVEIVAPAGALTFPIGTAADGAEAKAVDVATLPDYDIKPWAGHEEGAFAYIVHPFPLKSDGTVALGLKVPAGVTEAGAYRLYTIHTSTAEVIDAGLLEKDSAGYWRVADLDALHHVSILVAVPEASR